METVADSGLLRALDLVELNPILDMGNATAELGVELLLPHSAAGSCSSAEGSSNPFRPG